MTLLRLLIKFPHVIIYLLLFSQNYHSFMLRALRTLCNGKMRMSMKVSSIVASVLLMQVFSKFFYFKLWLTAGVNMTLLRLLI